MSVPMKHKNAQSGSILIIVAALMALAGTIMLLGWGSFKTQDPRDRILETSRKQEYLIDQLAAYVQAHNGLPCPASPAEQRNPPSSGFGTPVFGQGSYCGLGEGIVPFRALGLSVADAQDAWGNFMTYAVSDVLSDNKIFALTYEMRAGYADPSDRSFMIHPLCRRAPWFDNGDGTLGSQNTNLEKAFFCCPTNDPYNGSPSKDVKIFASYSDLQSNRPIGPNEYGSFGRTDTSSMSDAEFNAHYAVPDVSTGYLADNVPANLKNEMFAVAIVSHGPNGKGAYFVNGTYDRDTSGMNNAENENANGDLLFIDQPINLSEGSAYFDDLVVWRTQVGIMGELNNGTCYRPWR